VSAAERSAQRARLLSELDGLARGAAAGLRGKWRGDALADGVDRALPFAVVVPLLWLLGLGTGALDGLPRWWVLPATLLAPGLYLALLVLRAQLRPVADRDALAELDRELGLEDRLLTAREFLDAELDSPFALAALDDAETVLARARSVRPQLEARRWRAGGEARGIALVSLGLLAWVLLLGTPGPAEATRASGEPETPETLAALDAEPQGSTPELPEAQPEELPEPELRTGDAPPASPSEDRRRDAPGRLSDRTKEAAGKTGAGRSSDAESSSSASQSRGQPSNQSQASEAPKDKDLKPSKNKKPQEPRPTEETPRKSDEDDSGSTAGRGSSKGSSKNPVVSKWSSKDQVTHQDDQEIEDDEETEDEEEDQESRGGVQPNLRDRKPPVSRDLRIGFGNQKNPDANGRGGPSEAKKSRGTASLVLGVPIPDRVKGQPSPGKTKITQERIEPKPEEQPAVQAGARAGRQGPAGFVEERELTPWMRTLVREYFLALRGGAPQTQKETP